MDSVESRIRALQRIAYGAQASEAERAEAVAELGKLQQREPHQRTTAGAHPGTSGRPDSGGAIGDGSGGASHGFHASDASPSPSDAAAATPAPAGHRRGRAAGMARWALVAGAVGVVLGGVIGWGVGQRVPVEMTSSSTSASTPPSIVDPTAPVADGMPLESTDLLPLMGRLPTADEAARVARLDPPMDPESVGLLASRADGPTAFLARTVDGGDICLVVLMPSGPSRSACTLVGRFPIGGLRIEYYADGYGLVAAHLDDSGAVELNLSVPF